MSQNNNEQFRDPLEGGRTQTNTGPEVDRDNSGVSILRSDNNGNPNEATSSGVRPLSDVFLPTDVSMDPNHTNLGAAGVERSHRDSGYRTGASSSSCMTEPEMSPATFYISQDSVESEQHQQQQLDEFSESDDILFENLTVLSDDDADAELSDSDDHQMSGASVRTLCEADVPISSPMDIPSASCFHMAHDPAMVVMGATPPRSYMSHPISVLPSNHAQSSDTEHRCITGNRFSTSCLSNYYALDQLLSQRRDTRCGKLLDRGIKVTSGRLHASSSRAALQRQRTISDSDDRQESNAFLHRDRSQSAPDIGIRRKLIERQCAEELRKISDEFFEEFPRLKVGMASRDQGSSTPVSVTTHAASYPGTTRSRQWWWQTIIQNLSPARVRPSEPSTTEASGKPMTKEDKGDGK